MKKFDWKNNEKVGTHLMKYSKKEEYQRSAISRFYYSCFGPLKEYYEKSFRRTLSSKDAHSTLIKELQNSPFIEEQKLGIKLKNLRNMRNLADYNPKSQKFPLNRSRKNVKEIFLILNSLKNHPLRLMKK